MVAFITFLFGVLITGAYVAVASMIRGYVLSTLWGWFAVPLFGLPSIGIAAAWGVSLMVQTFRPESFDFKKDDRPTAHWKAVAYLFGPLLTLLFGWIAKSLM